jgi:formyltetrahydrofolate deformylase
MHILKVHCPDHTGLVYAVTGVLYKHGLNIVGNDEFVEKVDSRFFMRTAFSGSFDTEALLTELKSVLPASAEIALSNNHKKNIVLLATKEYHCLGDLLLRHQFGDLNANILGVISNHSTLQSLVEKFAIPYYFIDHTLYPKEEHEQQVIGVLNKLQPEFLVLAKYMRILSPQFVAQFRHRIINIHHSFLPAFVGANPYQKAYERGVKIIGATAHFVTNDLDEGPIIYQSVIPVNHSYSAKEMAQSGRDVEKIVLANALQLVLNERVFVHQNKTIIFD